MQRLRRNSITPMNNPDSPATLLGRLKSFHHRADGWAKKRLKEFIILISCMVAYGTVLMILSSGHFKPQTVWFVVQSLNALGFFLAVVALLKKSNP